MKSKKKILIGTLIFVLLFYSSLLHAQSSQITNGLNYLSLAQNPDGGWGSSPSTVYETALKNLLDINHYFTVVKVISFILSSGDYNAKM